MLNKVNRLEEIKLEIERLVAPLEEEKKRLEEELKKELQTQFNGETVYAKGDNISYYLYERVTSTLDKKALEKDGIDLEKYSKVTKSLVLSNSSNAKINALKGE